ncbi:MAG: hypothetical protein JNM51_09275 [Bacteroidia bacterium]|nr:hypothetical protein [Bacteroidia bacterium]
MENISNKTEVSINAGSTVQQIEQSFKALTLEDKVQIIRGWIEDEQDFNFPVCFKNDEVYKNFLNYIFIDSIDESMSNSKPFISGQDYAQETRRIVDCIFSYSENDWLMELYYAIDYAIQDKFFRKLKGNEVTIKGSDENRVTKLW